MRVGVAQAPQPLPLPCGGSGGQHVGGPGSDPGGRAGPLRTETRFHPPGGVRESLSVSREGGEIMDISTPSRETTPLHPLGSTGMTSAARSPRRRRRRRRRRKGWGQGGEEEVGVSSLSGTRTFRVFSETRGRVGGAPVRAAVRVLSVGEKAR